MAELKLSSSEFKVLSSKTRTEILKLLKSKNHTLTELSNKFNMSAPSMKQHMEQLVGTELVELRDEGRKWKYYALTRKGQDLAFSEERKTIVLLVISMSAIAIVALLMMSYNSIVLIGIVQQPEPFADVGGDAAPSITGVPAEAQAEQSKAVMQEQISIQYASLVIYAITIIVLLAIIFFSAKKLRVRYN